MNFRKHGEVQEVEVTAELIERARQGDAAASNAIAREILKHIHGAMKYFGIMENASPQEWKDFRDKTAVHVWESRLPVYDPDQTQFNTFIFSHVQNMWKNWLKNKAHKPLDQGPSLDEPVGEEGDLTGQDLLQDPLALDFKSEVEAQLIESALLENITNPRYQEILKLWIAEDPRLGPKEKAVVVAKQYNEAHPERPIQDYRMYRIMADEIFPLVLDKFPSAAKGLGFELNEIQDDKSKKWVHTPKEEDSSKKLVEEEEDLYAPPEEQVAPVYRIDPQTGERTLISLNMKRKLTAAQEAWCHTLLTFLSIERYGKSRHTIKSSTTR